LVNDNFSSLATKLRSGLKKGTHMKKRSKPVKVCCVFFTACPVDGAHGGTRTPTPYGTWT
jgi:hypothetical protein